MIRSLVSSRRTRAVVAGVLLAIVLLGWGLLPAIQAFTLVYNGNPRAIPSDSQVDVPVRDVSFAASDGVHLRGWLAIASSNAPTIILVHGFKGSRVSMLP